MALPRAQQERGAEMSVVSITTTNVSLKYFMTNEHKSEYDKV